MNSNQFRRWLAKQGCTFQRKSGGHTVVMRGHLRTDLPIHGGRKRLRKGLIEKIKKDLGLK